MTDLLSIGTSATQLYRQALTTVSNNIANMNTDGYSRQEIVSVENTPTLQGVYYLGNGASVETVTGPTTPSLKKICGTAIVS